MGKKGGNHLPTVPVRWHHMFSVTSPSKCIGKEVATKYFLPGNMKKRPIYTKFGLIG